MRPESVEQLLSMMLTAEPATRSAFRVAEAPEATWLAVLELHPELKRVVTLNRNLPDGILFLLANDKDVNVRCDVAMRRALPLSLRAALAHDKDETVRQRVACNKKTPITLLQELAIDSSELVRLPARAELQRRAMI